MQNTTRKLMEWIVARKLAQDLERGNVFPPNQGGYRTGKSTWEYAAGFSYDVYERFQKKEQTLAVAVDLGDAYNRMQFKQLMELLVQYGVSLMLTRWHAAALQKRGRAPWDLETGPPPPPKPQQPTTELPQASPPPPPPREGVWNGLAHRHKVFDCKDSCGSAALAMPREWMGS